MLLLLLLLLASVDSQLPLMNEGNRGRPPRDRCRRLLPLPPDRAEFLRELQGELSM